MARPHHIFFAKRFLPARVFEDPDAVFRALRGPGRERTLLSWWQEAGAQVDSTIEPLEVGKHSEALPARVHQLGVVGALEVGGQEVIALSMPPALEPNEAFYIALVRPEGGLPRIYLYERCLEDGEAVLASIEDLNSRANHGFGSGVEWEDFQAALGQLLGVSLWSLQGSQPSSEAWTGDARRTLALERVLWGGVVLAPVLSFLGRSWYELYFWEAPLNALYLLAALVMVVRWMRGAAAELITDRSFDQGAVVWAWLVPGVNLVGPLVLMRRLWKAAGEGSAGWLFVVWPLMVFQGLLALARVLFTLLEQGVLSYFPGIALVFQVSTTLFFFGHSSPALLLSASAYLGALYLVRRVERARRPG